MIDLKFDYDDILVTPDVLTDITSRYIGDQVNPYYEIKTSPFYHQQLPLLTAPMDSVVNH